jgi:hypothetical protein
MMVFDAPEYADIPIAAGGEAVEAEGLPLL